ncbi:hypothetical protein PTI98_011496 [Pleurotus ostreatus]|nr:hypothetical protein PTI98_011496 [Pleurotus ostreatus]
MIPVRLRLWTQFRSRTLILPIPSLMTMHMDRMNTTPLDLEVRPGPEDIRSQNSATIIRRPRSHSDDSPFTDIYATYLVPGKVSVPNGGNNLDVTITQLELDTKLTWITIPKKDARVHLQATVRNDSEFILIPGRNSVYVDGNFVGNVSLPMVHPQETFDCPLGFVLPPLLH